MHSKPRSTVLLMFLQLEALWLSLDFNVKQYEQAICLLHPILRGAETGFNKPSVVRNCYMISLVGGLEICCETLGRGLKTLDIPTILVLPETVFYQIRCIEAISLLYLMALYFFLLIISFLQVYHAKPFICMSGLKIRPREFQLLATHMFLRHSKPKSTECLMFLQLKPLWLSLNLNVKHNEQAICCIRDYEVVKQGLTTPLMSEIV